MADIAVLIEEGRQEYQRIIAERNAIEAAREQELAAQTTAMWQLLIDVAKATIPVDFHAGIQPSGPDPIYRAAAGWVWADLHWFAPGINTPVIVRAWSESLAVGRSGPGSERLVHGLPLELPPAWAEIPHAQYKTFWCRAPEAVRFGVGVPVVNQAAQRIDWTPNAQFGWRDDLRLALYVASTREAAYAAALAELQGA